MRMAGRGGGLVAIVLSFVLITAGCSLTGHRRPTTDLLIGGGLVAGGVGLGVYGLRKGNEYCSGEPCDIDTAKFLLGAGIVAIIAGVGFLIGAGQGYARHHAHPDPTPSRPPAPRNPVAGP
jgi:hypothetical protein